MNLNLKMVIFQSPMDQMSFDNLFLGRKSIVIEGIKANYEFLTYSSINPFL